VLVRKVLPVESSIWIDGGIVDSEDEFWELIIERLSLFQDEEDETASESTSGVEGTASAGADFLVVKGSGEISASTERTHGQAVRKTRSLSSRVAAVSGLRRAKLPLVIDDFHYLSRDLQASVVRALKPLIFDGLAVVVIAIPHRRYDAVKVEREMAGRISGISVPPWSEVELSFIPTKGFDLLGYDLDAYDVGGITAQSIGSPHLMQEFCRGLCRAGSVTYTKDRVKKRFTDDSIKAVFADVADTIGRPIFEKLARGPRQRSDRIPRKLKSGEDVDIYELVLHALASLKPGLVSLEYEDLRSAIREVSGSQLPQLQEVARVLKHMATIAATDQSSTPVIDFEEDEKKLHITDPFFAFYLRWGDLSA
jgi:hypothetical protein